MTSLFPAQMEAGEEEKNAEAQRRRARVGLHRDRSRYPAFKAPKQPFQATASACNLNSSSSITLRIVSDNSFNELPC